MRACIGLGAGTLEDGEVGISATNRNFKGRMGSRNAEAYLATPAVVAASAIAGFIDGPVILRRRLPAGRSKSRPRLPRPPRGDYPGGIPESLSGELIFCHQDNLNTDGIYPGNTPISTISHRATGIRRHGEL